MGKLGNTLTLLKLLQSGKKYTIKHLAQKLEVTPKMVKIYKEELEKAGIYIDSIKGVNGGYYYVDKSNNNYNVDFSLEELNVMEKILDYFEKNNRKEFIKDISIIIEKLKLISLYSKVPELELDPQDLKKQENFRKIISDAIMKNDSLLMEYINSNNEIVCRKIKPQNIHVYENLYFFTGFCYDIDEIRTYQFLKIISLTKLANIQFV